MINGVGSYSRGNPMTYVEYSASHGHGTLIEHGVLAMNGSALDCERVIFPSGTLFVQNYEIAAARYSEFIQIHGSERAV
jgi:hypothetical protein